MKHRRICGLLAGLVALGTLAFPAGTASAANTACYDSQPAPAGVVSTTSPDPLSRSPWATGHPRKEALWLAYCDETVAKAALAKIALRPRAYWFNEHNPTWSTSTVKGVRAKVAEYIADTQKGNPNVLVTMSLFRLWPNGESAMHTRLTLAQQDDYKAWMREVAAGIGSHRVAVVLEPDLGIVARQLKSETQNQNERYGLVRYAATVLGALPNAYVYLDGSSADWLHPDEAATMLYRAGVQYVRGFALGATHYSRLHRTSTTDPEQVGEVRYTQRVLVQLNALATAKGIPALRGKHSVIDTSDNLRGFTMKQFYARWPKSQGYRFDESPVCSTKITSVCVSLGIPPTWGTGALRWVNTHQMDTTEQALAARYVDGFLWFGRSWLYNQASPFERDDAIGMARSTIY